MPEFPIRDSIISSLTAQEPWPDNVKLFQPYEVEQILLPDNASCLAVQAFLKMCNLPFEVEMRWNAEFMSPSGRVPFIKCGAFVVSELEPIAQFAANKGVSLCARLSTEEKAEMRAYMSLITNVLVNAELYISWLDNDTFNQVTKVRNSSVYPWPLGWLQTRAKRNNVAKRLKALHWHDKTLEQVLADVEQCCNSLSQRLGDKDYFFGTPTQLDALVYGHVRALLSANGPKAGLMIKPITNAMLRHIVRLTNLVGMKLTPQEQYLLQQAYRSRRRSPCSSPSERSARARRSKLSVPHHSRDSINKDVFGFKPFASKQIIIMTTKEGSLTCQRDDDSKYGYIPSIDEEEYNLIVEIIEDVVDKVGEIGTAKLLMKADIEAEKNDFEVIAFPNQVESKNESLAKLEENDVGDTASTDGGLGDAVHIINDDNELENAGFVNELESVHFANELENAHFVNELDSNGAGVINEMDSDGVVNDKLLNEPIEEFCDDPESKCMSPGLTDSSNNENLKEGYLTTVTSSGDRASLMNVSVKSDSSNKSSRFSSESRATLKMPSEEISVETLLNYLRKRNAAYPYPEVADVD